MPALWLRRGEFTAALPGATDRQGELPEVWKAARRFVCGVLGMPAEVKRTTAQAVPTSTGWHERVGDQGMRARG